MTHTVYDREAVNRGTSTAGHTIDDELCIAFSLSTILDLPGIVTLKSPPPVSVVSPLQRDIAPTIAPQDMMRRTWVSRLGISGTFQQNRRVFSYTQHFVSPFNQHQTHLAFFEDFIHH